MAQVGHADSKMTMDVYAQLEQRADRSHGTQFDALLRARQARVSRALIGPRLGHETRNRANGPSSGDKEKAPQKAALCRHFSDGETRTRTGDTTIFSRVLYQLSYLAAAAQSSPPPPRPAAAGAGRSAAEVLGRVPAVGPDLEVQVRAAEEEPVLPTRPNCCARRHRRALGDRDRAAHEVHEDVVAPVGAAERRRTCRRRPAWKAIQ